MKRDPRLKRSGERVLLGYGGMHRRPRYYPCREHRATVIAWLARSMRIPVGILGLGGYGVYRAAEDYERQAALTLRLTADRFTLWGER